MSLSAASKNVILSNMYHPDLKIYLDKAPTALQDEVLAKFLKQSQAMSAWISNLRSEANSSKGEFPEHAQEFQDTANELEGLIETPKTVKSALKKAFFSSN